MWAAEPRHPELGEWPPGAFWKHSQLGGWLPGGRGMVEVACPAPLGPGHLIWTVGLGSTREPKAGVSCQRGRVLWGDLNVGGCAAITAWTAHLAGWVTHDPLAGLDVLVQVPDSPPSPHAAPACLASRASSFHLRVVGSNPQAERSCQPLAQALSRSEPSPGGWLSSILTGIAPRGELGAAYSRHPHPTAPLSLTKTLPPG